MAPATTSGAAEGMVAANGTMSPDEFADRFAAARQEAWRPLANGVEGVAISPAGDHFYTATKSVSGLDFVLQHTILLNGAGRGYYWRGTQEGVGHVLQADEDLLEYVSRRALAMQLKPDVVG
ncbi:MAG TPA: hypothetical protein VK674_03485 [Candidatus Limnocylindria bacterium]|nr:hypothetical protein [Candidatus Limnocylindria bacterium]